MSRMARRWMVALATTAALLVAGSVDAGAQAPSAPESSGGPTEIVGGTSAASGEFPYAVALLQHSVADPFQAQFCGGSLIAPRRVLTAAHCVEELTPVSVDVLVGTRLLRAGTGQRIAVSRIHVHPGWDNGTSDNDLAALDLAAPANSAPVTVVRPAESARWAPGTVAQIVGWGDQVEGGNQFPVALRKASVPVQSDAVCGDAYTDWGFNAATMFCAGPLEGGIDTCQGDSGGAITVGTGPDRRLIGIASWGVGCAEPGFPGVYTRLGSYTTAFDAFARAGAVPGAGGTLLNRNFVATIQAGEPRHAGRTGGASIWYRWTAPSSGAVVIDTAGSDFNTLLGIYTGGSVSALTAVASNDDASQGTRTSRVAFNAVAGVTYRIAIDGVRGAVGNTTLRVTPS